MSTALPDDARKLLSSAPEEFVVERTRLARELRSAGRDDEARRISELRKPPPVILALNRAARDRPRALKGAEAAAERLRRTQLRGDPAAYAQASVDLADSLELLEEVALAHLSRTRAPTEATRRRVRTALRAAVVDQEARAALAQGVLLDEPETSGFDAFAGMPVSPRTSAPNARPRKTKADERRRVQREQLEQDLERAERELRSAEQALAHAERERDQRAGAVAKLRAKRERLDGSV